MMVRTERFGAIAAVALCTVLLIVCSFSPSSSSLLSSSDAVTFAEAGGSTNPLYRSKSFILNPLVPLSHCTKLGMDGEFLFEWQLSLAPKWTMELRFTSDIQRGFSAVGFTSGERQQIILGYPVEHVECARSLWDNYSPYDQYGNVYPNFPEVPGKITYTNVSHAVHYLMRNLSLTSRTFLERQNGAAALNVTILWSFMQQSLFEAGCYMGNLNALTEYANFQLSLADPYYLRQNDGSCRNYEGEAKPAGPSQQILDSSGELLIGEMFQNTRAALLFLGGDLLVDAGAEGPIFAATGYVHGGNNGVCSASTNTIYARWSGFSQKIGGIVKYLVTVGTPELPSLFVDRYDVDTATSLTLTVGNLMRNVSYIVKVTAFDFAGLSVGATSRSVYVLNNILPVAGTAAITNSTGGRLRFQKDPQKLTITLARWIPEDYSAKHMVTDAFTDNNALQFAVGDVSVGIDSLQTWTSLGAFRTQFTVTLPNGVYMENNKKYTVSIRTTNCAGRTTQYTTDSITIDSTPPAGGIIRVGNNTRTHSAYMTLRTKVMVWWWGFTDYISGIGGYEWAISDMPNPPSLTGSVGMVKGWESVGLAMMASDSRTLGQIAPGGGASLINKNIYFHIKVTDTAGNYLIKTSNATRVVSG